jgi:hypothetical protein
LNAGLLELHALYVGGMFDKFVAVAAFAAVVAGFGIITYGLL